MQLKVEDASAKVALVETEIAFNEAVRNTLEVVDKLCQKLETGRAELSNGNVMAAIEILEATETTIRSDSLFTNTNIMSILSENVAGLRREAVDFLHTRWNGLLSVDRQQRKLRISESEENVTLDVVIAGLTRLEILAPANDKLQKDILSAIIDPILVPSVEFQSRGVRVGDSGVEVEPEASKATVPEVLDRISQVLGYLQKSLPASISATFSDYFIPTLSSKIITSWFTSAIPTELERLGEFEGTLDHIVKFSQSVESLGWHGHEELVSWVNQAPRLWLTGRRVDSLDQVRKVLAASHGTTKQVERVEKEQVKADEAMLDNGPTDDWDAGWDDENDEETNEKPAEPAEDEEDVSAWGLDDDAKDGAPEDKTGTTGPVEEDDDADDAWGLGDEEDEQPQKEPSEPPTTTKAKPANNPEEAKGNSSREVTLRETYMVTDIPDSILNVLRQQITDSEAISQPG